MLLSRLSFFLPLSFFLSCFVIFLSLNCFINPGRLSCSFFTSSFHSFFIPSFSFLPLCIPSFSFYSFYSLTIFFLATFSFLSIVVVVVFLLLEGRGRKQMTFLLLLVSFLFFFLEAWEKAGRGERGKKWSAWVARES